MARPKSTPWSPPTVTTFDAGICRPLRVTRLNWPPKPRAVTSEPFAVHAIDRDARDALERFRQVRIGELADVLGDDRVDDALTVAADVARALKAGADAGDDDLLVRRRGARLTVDLGLGLAGSGSGTSHVLRKGGRGEKRYGESRNACRERDSQLAVVVGRNTAIEIVHLSSPFARL